MAQLDACLSACFQLQRMHSFAKSVLLLVLCSSLSFASSADSHNSLSMEVYAYFWLQAGCRHGSPLSDESRKLAKQCGTWILLGILSLGNCAQGDLCLPLREKY